MWNWRASLGFVALIAVGLALMLPLPGHAPAIHLAAQARGASRPAPDLDRFRDMISVEGKEVPLPPGEWHIAGRAATPADAEQRVMSVALVRLRGADVGAAVLIQTNRMDTDPVWGKAAACDRTDLYFARIEYASDHDGSCAYAAYVDAAVPRHATDPAWQQALLSGAGHGWKFPPSWVEAAYRISDRHDAMQVRYLFNPANGIDRSSVKTLVAWTEASWRAVGSGFRNRLGADDALPDWRHPSTHDAAAPPPVDAEQSEVAHLSVKATTYRIFATLTDMSVNYVWLGSLPSASGLAIVGATASSVLYFFHELIWSRYEHPQVLVGDLPGVGIEGPGPVQ